MSDPDRFVWDHRAVRVVFGTGAIDETSRELERAGISRALVIFTPGRANDAMRLRRDHGSRVAAAFGDAHVHVPAAVADAARAAAAEARADGLIALGGGSAIGVAKAVALTTALPIIAIPTTYSGSEMTSVWGLTDAGAKQTGRDARVAPRTVIYDPALTLTLPAAESATSGMNAAAHAVEALYAPDAHPLASLAAAEALRLLAHSLPRIVAQLDDAGARADALRAAYLAGTALDATSMGLHHRICHVLGGSFGLPHAPTHAVLLPYVVAWQQTAAPQAMAAIARAIDVDDAAQGLQTLARSIGVPVSLAALGLARDAIPAAADLAARNPPAGPRAVTRDDIVRVLDMAFEGAHFVRR